MCVPTKEQALNNAIASVEMEGYKVTEAEKQQCMRFLNGEITKSEFIQSLLEKVGGQG